MDIIARIDDAVGINEATLLWRYNGESYGCPTQTRYVDCIVTGNEYRWTVVIGRAADRPFSIRARNTRGRSTTTPERTLFVRDNLDDDPPAVAILDPTADTRWNENTVVSVRARITDDLGIDSVNLEWDFNGNDYPCPHQSQYVDCSVDGETYHWTVQVGTGTRQFRVRAVDSTGNTTVSADHSVNLSVVDDRR